MTAQFGQQVLLAQMMLRAEWFGQRADGDTPQSLFVKLSKVLGDPTVTTDALVGPPGEPGQWEPLIKLQWPEVAQAADIDVTKLTTADKNKGWWVLADSRIHVWTGTQLVAVMPGPVGANGILPDITPDCVLVQMPERVGADDNVDDVDSKVEPAGTSLLPFWTFHVASPQGPVGPATPISDAPDYDGSTPATFGQAMTWNEADQKWYPSTFQSRHSVFYSIPEGAFTSFTGFEQRKQICHFEVPAQTFNWTPYVLGHIKAIGVELTSSVIGFEVVLGDPDPSKGQLIGRGFGTNTSWALLVPHYTDPSNTTVTVKPGNGVATVLAGDTADIYVNLYNDGAWGAYAFNRTNAQLSIMVVATDDDPDD